MPRFAAPHEAPALLAALLVAALLPAVATIAVAAPAPMPPEALPAYPTAAGIGTAVAGASLIAFVLPDGRPAVVDAASRETTPLTQATGRSAFPAWSPDGDRLAYIALATTARVDVFDTVCGGEPRSVYESVSDAPIYLYWSPTGERLALLAADSGGLSLHLADPSGGPSRWLTRGSPFYWTWNRAGDRLLVHRDVLSEGALVGFTGLDAFRVDEPYPDPGAFGPPALSASERYMAYAALRGGDDRRVVVAPLPGAGPAAVQRELPHRGQAALAWHPRLDLLAIQRAEERTVGSISLLDADSGELDVVVPGRSLAFFWSPDGGSIAYLTLVVGSNVDPERRVGDSFRMQQSGPPRLALQVIDVSTGLTRELATFVPSRLLVEQYLPFFDQYARSHRVWSPASDALVFTAVDAAGVPTITVFGLDGSVTPLTPGEMPSWNVR